MRWTATSWRFERSVPSVRRDDLSCSRAALGAHGGSILPVVLPNPAFGWTILDAIDTYAHSEVRR